MSFYEELAAVLQEAKGKVQTRRDFEESWQAARRDLIKPLLDEAVVAVTNYLAWGEVECRNGSIVLAIKNERHSLTVELVFQPVLGKLFVACTSTLEGYQEERFALTALTAEVIQGKVKEFARAVAMGGQPRKSEPAP
jgi:hypothetical protein